MTRSENTTQLRAGDTLGGYQLLVAVGVGGMGKVWAARRVDSPGQNLVAVKTALEEMAGDEQFERMLLDEARIAASIVHPNVCAIREVGSEKGTAFLVMDWMDAGSFLDILTASPERRIDFYLAVRIISDVAAGLHAAHELTGPDGTPLNVVHRDVSPQNVLLSSAGHVKVADFGVAKAKGQLHAPTETGEVKGKLSYMAPEQLTSKIFDRRADIFALGCCLYEATTGQRPFHGGDALETMYKLLETACAPPSTLVEGYPAELEAIVLRTLEKDPEKRYQTADDLRVALEGFLARSGRLVTDREVSVLVRTTLANALESKAKALQTATTSIANRKLDSSRDSGRNGGAEGFDDTETDHAKSGDTAQAWNTSPPPNRSKKINLGALLTIATVVAAALLVWANNRGLAPAPNPALTSSSVQAATPVQRVTIRLATEPAGAAMRIDEGPPMTGPQVIVTEASSAEHKIEVTHDGFETSTRKLVYDRNQEILIGLTPHTQEPAPLGSAPVKAPKAAASVPKVTNADTATNAVDVTTGRRKRPKRPIDPNNPFSDP